MPELFEVEITCEQNELEDLAYTLSQHNLHLVESNQRYLIYCEQSDLDKINSFNLQVLKTINLGNQNWVQKSESIWEEVVINNLKITPVSTRPIHRPSSGQIYIIPSTGFGTGKTGDFPGTESNSLNWMNKKQEGNNNQ